MRNRILTVLALSGTILLAGAGYRHICSRTVDAPTLDVPDVLFIAPHHYGDISEGVFRITNTGRLPLIVDEFRTGCGCDGLDLKSQSGYVLLQAVEIEPEKFVEIRMRHKVRGRIGKEERTTIYFRTNDPVRPEGNITIVIPTVNGGAVAFPSVVMVGEMPVGRKAIYTVELFDSAVKTRKVVNVSLRDSKVIAARLLPLESEPALDSFGRGVLVGRIEVVVSAEVPTVVEEIIGVALDDGEFTSDAIAVRGQIVSSIQATPSACVLPRASSSGPLYDVSCICRSTAGHPIKLEFIEASEGLSAILPSEHAISHVVIIKFDRSKSNLLKTSSTGLVKLIGKWAGGQEEIVIPVKFIVP